MERYNIRRCFVINHEDKRPIIGVDFDGTLVKNEFPNIGKINYQVVEYITNKKKEGATVVLWTTRQNQKLKEALDFCKENNIPIDYANQNPPWLSFETSNKIFADIYVDDRSINPIGEPNDLVKFASDKELDFDVKDTYEAQGKALKSRLDKDG